MIEVRATARSWTTAYPFVLIGADPGSKLLLEQPAQTVQSTGSSLACY